MKCYAMLYCGFLCDILQVGELHSTTVGRKAFHAGKGHSIKRQTFSWDMTLPAPSFPLPSHFFFIWSV